LWIDEQGDAHGGEDCNPPARREMRKLHSFSGWQYPHAAFWHVPPFAVSPGHASVLERFPSSHCSTPVCTPARASLFTGRWPHTHGLFRNVRMVEPVAERGLPPDARTLPALFHAAGYTTAFHGKWHLGSIRRHPCFTWDPAARDYEPAYARFARRRADELGLAPPAALPGGLEVDGWPLASPPACRRAAERVRAAFPGFAPVRIGRMTLPLELDRTRFLTDRLLADLDRYAHRPFQLTWSAEPPHAPWAVQDPYHGRIDPASIERAGSAVRPARYDPWPAARLHDWLGPDGVREYLRCYLGMVEKVDDEVGRILARLEELGRLDDTLIVFLSDHGDMNGAHGVVGKGINFPYEEIARVPLVLRLPGVVDAGRRVETLVEGVDLLPTLLELCGLPVPPDVQGESLVPLLGGREHRERAAFLENSSRTRSYSQRTVRTDEWKLCYSFRDPGPHRASYVLRWAPELYCLARDPREERDLGGDPRHARVRARLTERLVDWMERTGDPWRARLPAGLA